MWNKNARSTFIIHEIITLTTLPNRECITKNSYTEFSNSLQSRGYKSRVSFVYFLPQLYLHLLIKMIPPRYVIIYVLQRLPRYDELDIAILSLSELPYAVSSFNCKILPRRLRFFHFRFIVLW